MTVNANPRRAGPFVGTGLIVAYSFDFKVFEDTDLLIVRAELYTGVTTDLVLDSDYSVALNPDQEVNPGGTVSYLVGGIPTALPITQSLTIVGNLPFTQPTDITNQGGFYPQVIEDALDRVTMLVQQNTDAVSRSLQLNVATDPDFNVQMPAPVPLNLLGWDAAGLQLQNFPGAATAPVVAAQLAQFISDLADPTDPSRGDALVAVKQPVTAAADRTQHQKNFDFVSSNDFAGITPDATIAGAGTDSTAGLQAAINWCSTNGRKLKLIGLVRITSPLTYTGQIFIEGEGDPQTYDSGIVYTGAATTMWQGSGINVEMSFVNLRNLAIVRPTALSNVRCLYGDFYRGGAEDCIFRGWGQAVECFGTMNRFKRNRFIECDNGILVTNWPLTSGQPGIPTTTFLSEDNNYFGCVTRGLAIDTTTTGGDNVVSSRSCNDVFEASNGVSFYLNKSFDFELDNPHFENSTTWAIQSINSVPTIIKPYLAGPSEIAKQSLTWPSAMANQAGQNRLDFDGLLTRGIHLRTKNGTASLTANDAGGIDLAGTGLVGYQAWTPALGSAAGVTTGLTYGTRVGHYLKFGKFVRVKGVISLTALPGTMTGEARLLNLPFPISSDPNDYNAWGAAVRHSRINLTGGYTQLGIDAVTGTSYAVLVQCGSGLAAANLAVTQMVSNSIFSFDFEYISQT